MNQFKIFVHSHSNQIQAVKQGFCWPAFIAQFFGFGWVWALVKEVWNIGIVLGIWWIGSWIILFCLTPEVDYYGRLRSDPTGYFFWCFVCLVVNVVIWIVLGIKGNGFRESTLIKRGYKIVDTVIENDAASAIRTYQETTKQ